MMALAISLVLVHLGVIRNPASQRLSVESCCCFERPLLHPGKYSPGRPSPPATINLRASFAKQPSTFDWKQFGVQKV